MEKKGKVHRVGGVHSEATIMSFQMFLSMADETLDVGDSLMLFLSKDKVKRKRKKRYFM